MPADHATKARGRTGRSEALQYLERLEAQARWLAENWDRIGIESCLDRLADARRDLAGAGAALIRDAFVEACVRHSDPAEIERVLELMYRLPGPPAPGP